MLGIERNARVDAEEEEEDMTNERKLREAERGRRKAGVQACKSDEEGSERREGKKGRPKGVSDGGDGV